jgi:glutathione synthase/RimK-type ligase-like ATP-grasp enzyme
MLAYSRRKGDRPLLAEVIANLTTEGFEVATGVAELLTVSPEALRVEADLYIFKSHSSLWLNLAAVLDAQQARILNSYAACVATNNKIRSSSRLHAAQVPIPRSWVTGDLARIPEVTDAMPLLLKPNIGRSGNGIRLVRDWAELATTQIEDGMLIQ